LDEIPFIIFEIWRSQCFPYAQTHALTHSRTVTDPNTECPRQRFSTVAEAQQSEHKYTPCSSVVLALHKLSS